MASCDVKFICDNSIVRQLVAVFPTSSHTRRIDCSNFRIVSKLSLFWWSRRMSLLAPYAERYSQAIPVRLAFILGIANWKYHHFVPPRRFPYPRVWEAFDFRSENRRIEKMSVLILLFRRSLLINTINLFDCNAYNSTRIVSSSIVLIHLTAGPIYFD